MKVAEIKLSAFLAEHNLAFRTMDHLCPLLANIFHDSKIAKNLSIRRTKAKNIVTNVIAENYKRNLTQILKITKFSILADESTDISTTKTLCVVVRYFDRTLGKITISLWEYLPTFNEKNASNSQGTAEHLYKIIIDTFTRRGIP